MTNLHPRTVADALQRSLSKLAPALVNDDTYRLPENQNLLELVDSFRFVELLAELEDVLELEFDVLDVNLADIVHAKNLIAFICAQATDRQEAAARVDTSW